ncbi:MAG: ComEC/Rec2 family competence protein, partial [Bacteroidota bacterium]|nr:ComEC/Rec2 family competence protein [Bacteroidota bacterium]
MGIIKFLHQAPFIRFVVPFVIGILIGINFIISVPTFAILSIIFFLILVFFKLKLFSSYSYSFLFGVLISLFFILSGISLINYAKAKIKSVDEKLYSSIVYLTSEPAETENSVKAFGKILCLKDSASYKSINLNTLLYFKKDSNSKKLKIGDKLVLKSYINEIKHNGNPNAFNYKKYLSYKGIKYQAYIKSGNWEIIDSNIGNPILLYANKIRRNLLSVYKEYDISGDELAVLSALTLGYKSDLSNEIKQSYAASGAMHILAVSGLHVGIIFIILNNLLFFLERNYFGKIIKVLIIIGFLAFYTLLTGMSSSVLRASIMFACFSFGNLFNRQTNIYNTLAVSAFIILAFNPYAIMDVGFQLSYIAVISIVFFQAKIYGLINISNYIGNKIWELLSVSIAAQIGTFPIAIYYFHQFPNYFW